jgi:hypothetical protein
MKLSKTPQNEEKFLRLYDFFREILDICHGIGVYPILEGSLAVFLYTGNDELVVDDIDLSHSEKHFPKIVEALVEHDISAEIKEWHELEARRDDLKVEFGDPDYWRPGVPIESDDDVEIGNHKVDVLRFDSLISSYEIDVRRLRKETLYRFPFGKRQKYLDVKKTYQLLVKTKQLRSSSIA